MRAVLAWVLPRPGLFRASMILARLGRPLAALLPTPRGIGDADFIAADQGDAGAGAAAACRRRDQPAAAFFRPQGERRGRVALLQGCAQQVLAPRINQAAINLLTRHGIEVVLVKDEQCCGALTHHLGRDGDALARARANIAVWHSEAERNGLDAILVTTSGCGTVIKDYGFMLREDRDFAGAAAKDFGAGQGHHRVCRRHRSAAARSSTAISSSPITRPVRCSTDRKSRSFRKNCFPRTDSW